MIKKFTLLSFTLLFSYATYSQCLMYPISLEPRIANAEFIVEGKVIAKQSFWNVEHTLIYTSNTIELYKILKGSIKVQQINVITQGGAVGEDLHVVNPSLKLNIGQTALFFLQYSTNAYTANNLISFDTYAGAQGCIKYDLKEKTAADPFKKYVDIDVELYQTINKQIAQSYTEIKPLPILFSAQKNSSAISIASFSPSSVHGGTGDVLTINGSGFGASYSGSADLEFKNPDDGGATYASVPADHIISWSDTKIMVTVPGGYASGLDPGAGTGTFRVTNSSASSAESATELDVAYNESAIDYSGGYYLPKLVNENSAGGYTWKYNTDFNNNSAAVTAFESALKTWNCATEVNFNTSGTTSTSCDADDSENIISFDANCPLPTGVLGTSFSFYSGCNNGTWKWYVKGNDILFAVSPGTSYTWNYGPAASTLTQYDIQSVMTHEMGHSHQLSHIIATGKLMNYALYNGDDVRSLNDSSDVAGGDDVMTRSVISNSCGPTAMTLKTVSGCGSAPVADFSADITSGCAPLTASFTDASTNTPTSWAWDFDNDGTTDATSQNPSHTYNSAGTYTVKLTATNSSGSDIETQASYITVFAKPVVDFQANPTSTTTATSIQFTDLSTGSTINAWYWDFGDTSNVSYLQNPTHSYSYAGNKSVTLSVVDANFCADTLTKSNYIVISTPTGLVNVGDNSQVIKINPNPFSDYAIISFENSFYSSTNIRLNWHDVLGREIEMNTTYENGNIILHKNQLPSGIYFGQFYYQNKLMDKIKVVVK